MVAIIVIGIIVLLTFIVFLWLLVAGADERRRKCKQESPEEIKEKIDDYN